MQYYLLKVHRAVLSALYWRPAYLFILLSLLFLSLTSMQFSTLWRLSDYSGKLQLVRLSEKTLQSAQWQLFGIPKLSVSSMTLTQLPIQMQGSIVSSPAAKNNMAILSVSGKPAKIYHVGDALMQQVSISSISAQSVVVRHAGQYELVKLPKLSMA